MVFLARKDQEKLIEAQAQIVQGLTRDQQIEIIRKKYGELQLLQQDINRVKFDDDLQAQIDDFNDYIYSILHDHEGLTMFKTSEEDEEEFFEERQRQAEIDFIHDKHLLQRAENLADMNYRINATKLLEDDYV